MPFAKRFGNFLQDHFCSCTKISEADVQLRIPEPNLTDKTLLEVRDGHCRKNTLALDEKMADGSTARIHTGFNTNDIEYRKVAFKIADNDKSDLILSEYKLLRSIRHRNIIKVFGIRFSVADESTIMIMEKARGDLLTYVKRSRGPIARHWRKRWKVELVCAVDYLHNKNIVHGDIKCENILLNHHFMIILADFGSAEKKDNVVMMKCVLEYFPPELVFRGSRYLPPDYDPTLIDVWGIGVVLFFVLTKRLPFGEGSPAKKYTEHHNRPITVLLSQQEAKLAGSAYIVLLDKLLDFCPTRRISTKIIRELNYFDSFYR